MRRLLVLLAVAMMVVGLAGCGASQSGTQASGITVRDPWVRAAMMNMAGDQSGAMGNMQQGNMQSTPMAGMGGGHSHGNEYGNTAVSAAYMVLENKGSTADAIVKAESDVAKTVELHNVIMENNVMQMRPVEAIEVPANGQVELKPGGFHVMLIGLTRDLKEGEEVMIKLTTRSGKTIEVKAPVRKP
ncbi:copper chaperone PCu(A)C [uncultured Chloroflexus sp.]|uniref:copper chaperone PCu(A)C n=1 Tax=uncultured Chloroflexus sp. TaxID=214040 RepID=UPI00261842E6|nr:copper chaperone PCu(A)C [uncultured Chloroflexus sp.]